MEQPPNEPDLGDFEELLRGGFTGANDPVALSSLDPFSIVLADGRVVRADAVACWNRACVYRTGEGAPKNDEKAREWTLRAAENGHPDAQYDMGLMLMNGDGLPQDYYEAARWFRLAAEQGHSWAQGNLGTLSAQGLGVLADTEEALKWWRLAAEQGHSVSQFNLGLWYDEVAEDFETAAEYYRRAAEQGHPRAARNLAVLYQERKCHPPDER